MRLFLALPVSESAKFALLAAQRRLPASARLIPEDNFHVTVAFLGDCSQSVAEELHDGLARLDLELPAIRLKDVGQFGNSKPRTFWAGVGPQHALNAAHRKVVTLARNSGADIPKRKFVPHVTLCRFSGEAGVGIPLPQLPTSACWQPEALVLYQSHLGGDVPVYEPLWNYPLRALGEPRNAILQERGFGDPQDLP